MRTSPDVGYGLLSSDLLLRRGSGASVPCPPGKRSNGAALGISNPPRHPASARRVAVCSISARLCTREDAARTANGCAGCARCAMAMIWCKPSCPSTLVDVRSPTPPWNNMQGVWCTPIPELRPATAHAIYPAESSTRRMVMLLPLAPKQLLRLGGLETAGSCSCASRSRSRCGTAVKLAALSELLPPSRRAAALSHSISILTEMMTDPTSMLAKSHRAGGNGARRGCGTGMSSELTAVSKHRPMAEPL
ncbi:uncharacterized protein M421DRAFT_90589 [Didymella exigua CBS 183.55]|uniref:Uncharacterized protein n=1 Tax=Didymella exigua CBS 183.55 TaxID=1150837 RepID=A0A6A5RSK2_9PLEO|nr:uncharacterized protein M421DRAFT_90589 [Didymella exigua CBS 183.55]KAF1930762.1 hypothetical protein M421DRAFT_90589 [Didymella exigua CBS 183.55]